MNERRLLVTVAAVIVALSVITPAVVTSRPANQLPLTTVESADGLQSPDGDKWDDIPGRQIALSSAPSGLPHASDTSVSHVGIKVARTDERLFVRLRWPDETADRNITGPRSFADAAAVQVPVNVTKRPPIAMGSSRSLVNVWYWHADGRVQELLAGGPGTTTQFAEPSVTARAAYDGGNWTVVYSRPLAPTGENRTTIRPGQSDVDVAVAVWNGSNMERSGVKSVSEWYTIPTGPAPQGPPYATILWSIAGLAVAVVIVVTIQAVRSRGGE